MAINNENLATSIEKMEIELKTCDKNCFMMEDKIKSIESKMGLESKEICNKLRKIKTNFTNELIDLAKIADKLINKENCDCELKIGVDRFSGVFNKTEELLLDMKGELQEIELEVAENKKSSNKQKGESKTKISILSAQVLNSRQTPKEFIYTVMKPSLRYKCITCNEPITINSPYLRHMEEYPTGSSVLKPHWYHAIYSCLVDRGFQRGYLSETRVISEEKFSDAANKCLKDIGFSPKNVQWQPSRSQTGEGDYGGSSSSLVSDSTPANRYLAPLKKFILMRKDNRNSDRVVCVSCQTDIKPDSYLARGNESGAPVHIARSCVLAAVTGTADPSKIKCLVGSLLRNNNELKQLLACGFVDQKIIGNRPQNATNKDISTGGRSFSPAPLPHTPPMVTGKSTYFVYRRNDGPTKHGSLTCIGCHSIISQPSFLTYGDTFSRPLHIRKRCIHNFDSGPNDLSVVKCKVFTLLKNHDELRDLLACGIYYNNIIGVRPQNPNIRADPGKQMTKEVSLPVTKDVGFIFNEEPFYCERLIRAEHCEGCLKYMTKGDLSLRHKERIPREKLKEFPLVSQYYHLSRTCLMQRGFTEKFLEFVFCNVTLTEQDNGQSVKDTVIRCGFSSENIKFTNDNKDKNVFQRSAVPVADSGPVIAYLYIVISTKSSSSCGGCGFNIVVNDSCFLYGSSVVQDNVASKLFHIKRLCLEKHFTKSEMVNLTCINNNSIADVSAETIVRCGIENIITRPPAHSTKSTGIGLPRNIPPPVVAAVPVPLPTFFVDTVMDKMSVCAGCHTRLQMSHCVLQAISGNDSPNEFMHLAEECVRRRGYSAKDLSQCDVILSVQVSPDTMAILDRCGFRYIR